MRKLNIFSLSMSLLSMIFLFSIGFSTWLAVPRPDGEGTGSFTSYPVEYMSDYISTTKNDIEVFDYAALHFWNDDQTAASDTGKISITYTVYLDKCKAAVEAKGGAWSGTLDIQTNLWYENLTSEPAGGLFSEINDGTYSRSVSAAISGYDPEVTNSGSMMTVANTFTGLAATGEFSFTVVYTLTVPMNTTGTDTPANFRHCLGKYLKAEGYKNADGQLDGETEFHTSARVITVE